MPNTVNYVTQFEKELKQKYSRELLTADLTTQNVTFIGANKIKIPYITVSGYKDHSRNGGFNRGTVQNDFMEKTLAFDRDIEFFVDSMDVDETNQALSAANVTKLLTGVPEIRIRDKVYPVDNRAKTVKKLMKELNSIKADDDKSIDTDEMIINAAFGKKAKEILEMNMPLEAQIEISQMALAAMTGDDYEVEKKEERFPEGKESP